MIYSRKGSVSYTHLDVYKRQELFSIRRKWMYLHKILHFHIQVNYFYNNTGLTEIYSNANIFQMKSMETYKTITKNKIN